MGFIFCSGLFITEPIYFWSMSTFKLKFFEIFIKFVVSDSLGISTSTVNFLKVIQPKLSLISYGKNNSYGHPHGETLERLEACGSKILTTVDCGAITLKIGRKRIEIKCFKKDD